MIHVEFEAINTKIEFQDLEGYYLIVELGSEQAPYINEFNLILGDLG